MKIRQTLIAAALGAVLSGGVFAGSMTASEATDLLARRGYDNISVLEYENGYWIGNATNPVGEVVAVSVDPVEQKITTSSNGRVSTTTVTTKTTTRAVPAPQTVVVEKEVPVVVEKEVPVVVERTVDRPVVVERVIERPVVRQPILVREQVIVPLGERIDKTDVAAVLHGAGYHNVHDIDWLSNRGVWKAEARDPSGDDREIHVDPYDGRIVHVEDD
jgi:hypothetical protein